MLIIVIIVVIVDIFKSSSNKQRVESVLQTVNRHIEQSTVHIDEIENVDSNVDGQLCQLCF